jgi:hypothetical protein
LSTNLSGIGGFSSSQSVYDDDLDVGPSNRKKLCIRILSSSDMDQLFHSSIVGFHRICIDQFKCENTDAEINKEFSKQFTEKLEDWRSFLAALQQDFKGKRPNREKLCQEPHLASLTLAIITSLSKKQINIYSTAGDSQLSKEEKVNRVIAKIIAVFSLAVLQLVDDGPNWCVETWDPSFRKMVAENSIKIFFHLECTFPKETEVISWLNYLQLRASQYSIPSPQVDPSSPGIFLS